MAKLKNWRIENSDGFCRLTLDKPGSSQNVLSAAVIDELNHALAEIEQAAPDAVLICSAKTGGFIVGADVGEFSAIESEPRAAEMLARAHEVMNRLEALPMPTVALINGHCLGGGLELALACDHRVVCDDPSIRLGLPEVMLGIHPGFGGSARLIETVGALAAMDLMLSGRSVSPTAARRMGMVDFAVPHRQLERTARYVLEQKAMRRRLAQSFITRTISQIKPKIGNWKKLLNTAPARAVLAWILRKKIAARVDPAHYPAPFQLIDLWRKHGGNRNDMLKAEQASVAQLITTPTSRNLVKVFFLREGLKKTGRTKTSPTKTNQNKTDQPFRHVHVIGAGVMGGDIAAWCALRGLMATVHDQNPDALANAIRRAHRLFKLKLKSPRLVQLAMDRFQPDPGGHGARRADLIIEAIVENAEAKIAVFSEVLAIARRDALLATNTSSIPLETIGEALGNSSGGAGRLVGLHFFNPVAKMQLVEIIRGAQTNAGAVKRAAAFAERIGRLPVTVKSCPGFLVNRILMPYLLEAVELVHEGVPNAVVDQAAMKFGMPMGPVTLADTVGLDICLQVAQNLCESYGGEVPEVLRQKVDAGKLGKKSGEGFYRWVKGKPQKTAAGSNARTQASIRDRLIFRYLNEAVACLHEGIVAQPDHLDAGLIFGTGFAPFRGGPIHYIAEQGADNLLRKLGALHEQYGERFAPCAGWSELDFKSK